MQRYTMLWLCFCLLKLGLQDAHGGPAAPRPVGGLITPAHFRFKEIVPASSIAPSGWKAACVIAQMNVIETNQRWECVFEVGVPQINENNGRITDAAAASAAAVAANAAVRVVLGSPPPHIAAVQCDNFRKLTGKLLQVEISGARVSELNTLKRAACTQF